MTDPKETPRREIKAREPKKARPDTFANLRSLPQTNLEEIMGLASPAPEHIITTPVPTPAPTPVPTGVAKTEVPSPRRESDPYLDATHTASERSIYSVMYRETISKGISERHFGFKELSTKTGIRSDRTMRLGLDGLQAKLSIEIVTYRHGDPLGPRYRIYEPRDIIKRRRAAGIEIDSQSKRITSTGVGTGVSTGVPTPAATGVKTDGSTPVETTPVTPVVSTGVSLNNINPNSPAAFATEASSSNQAARDDEAFAGLNQKLKAAAREVTGKDTSAAEGARWSELAELLVAELQIAAARTTVSSAPAFLMEHLRRRLWKKDKAQLERESREATSEPEAKPAIDTSKCPDCGGAGWFYPEGQERGVAKCRHEKLRAETIKAPQAEST